MLSVCFYSISINFEFRIQLLGSLNISQFIFIARILRNTLTGFICVPAVKNISVFSFCVICNCAALNSIECNVCFICVFFISRGLIAAHNFNFAAICAIRKVCTVICFDISLKCQRLNINGCKVIVT